MEVEAAEVEVDGVAEALSIAETTGGVLEPLDTGVDRFSACVSDATGEGGNDAMKLVFDHARDTLDRFAAAADGRPVCTDKVAGGAPAVNSSMSSGLPSY